MSVRTFSSGRPWALLFRGNRSEFSGEAEIPKRNETVTRQKHRHIKTPRPQGPYPGGRRNSAMEESPREDVSSDCEGSGRAREKVDSQDSGTNARDREPSDSGELAGDRWQTPAPTMPAARRPVSRATRRLHRSLPGPLSTPLPRSPATSFYPDTPASS